MHELRRDALDGAHTLAVEAELEDVHRFGVACELRVERLVTPPAKLRGPFDPQEKIRVPAPSVCHERALVNDIDAIAHRSDGRGRRPLPSKHVARYLTYGV